MGFEAFVGGLFSTLKFIGRSLGHVAAPVVKAIVQGAKDFVNGVVIGVTEVMRDEPKSAQESNERELQQVNEEIVSLQKRYRERGSLDDQQKRRWANLKERRDSLNLEIAAIDKFSAAEEIVQEEKNYRPIVINDDNAHILQYHVGQSAYNKLCQCGRVMVLQWNRSVETAGLHDFFWGCSGYYIKVDVRPVCQRTQKLTMNDLNLFANLSRPEFEIDSLSLTRETIDPVKARRIRQALDSIEGSQHSKRMGIATYRCPVHGESLRLKRKNQASDQLLDEYFLGCPRWLPDNAGCNFLVKLKSAAQISGVLNGEGMPGVLGVGTSTSIRTRQPATESMRKVWSTSMSANVNPVAPAKARIAATTAPREISSVPVVPPPSGFAVKVPSQKVQAEIDRTVIPNDGSWGAAVRAAIRRNQIWVESGEAGVNLTKVDIPKLEEWAVMTESQIAAEINKVGIGSPNTKRLVVSYKNGTATNTTSGVQPDCLEKQPERGSITPLNSRATRELPISEKPEQKYVRDLTNRDQYLEFTKNGLGSLSDNEIFFLFNRADELALTSQDIEILTVENSRRARGYHAAADIASGDWDWRDQNEAK